MEFFSKDVEKLEFHGTTSVFCEIDHNPYSWIYMPSSAHESHRIICTGNFSPSNNPGNTMTGTIEFTDELSKEEIEDNLKRIPLHPKYIKHQFNPYTYPIQDKNTKQLISLLFYRQICRLGILQYGCGNWRSHGFMQNYLTLWKRK